MSPRLTMPTIRLLLLITGSLRSFSLSMCCTAFARSSSSRQQWIPSVITSPAIVRRGSNSLRASPLQTMSRSVTIPISRSSSPIGMQPMSCSRISFASSLTGVLGLTQSTPLCITSLTRMVDLRFWVSGTLDAMQLSPTGFPDGRSTYAPAPDAVDKCSVVRAKAPVRCIGRQPRKLRVTHMKQRLVIASFHIDVRLCLDAVVDDDIQPVAFADGRNRTVYAVAEQLIDLGLIGQVDVVAELLPQVRQADVVRCRQDGQHIFAVAPQHDALGESIARDMACLSGTGGRHAD